MDIRDDENRTTGEPLMAPLEEIERRVYPSRGDGEPMTNPDRGDGLLPDQALPTAVGQPLPAPAPDGFGDGTLDDEARKRR
jgi:hypothetical protein